MSSFAEEREYSYAQKAMRLTEYILLHGSITLAEARKVTGCRDRQLYRLLCEMEGALPVYREGKKRVWLSRK